MRHVGAHPHETEAHSQSGQSIKLGERAANNDVVVLLDEALDIRSVVGDERGISLVDEYNR